jgi:hypothetical protein
MMLKRGKADAKVRGFDAESMDGAAGERRDRRGNDSNGGE